MKKLYFFTISGSSYQIIYKNSKHEKSLERVPASSQEASLLKWDRQPIPICEILKFEVGEPAIFALKTATGITIRKTTKVTQIMMIGE